MIFSGEDDEEVFPWDYLDYIVDAACIRSRDFSATVEMLMSPSGAGRFEIFAVFDFVENKPLVPPRRGRQAFQINFKDFRTQAIVGPYFQHAHFEFLWQSLGQIFGYELIDDIIREPQPVRLSELKGGDISMSWRREYPRNTIRRGFRRFRGWFFSRRNAPN